jgi:hypothetical protein
MAIGPFQFELRADETKDGESTPIEAPQPSVGGRCPGLFRRISLPKFGIRTLFATTSVGAVVTLGGVKVYEYHYLPQRRANVAKELDHYNADNLRAKLNKMPQSEVDRYLLSLFRVYWDDPKTKSDPWPKTTLHKWLPLLSPWAQRDAFSMFEERPSELQWIDWELSRDNEDALSKAAKEQWRLLTEQKSLYFARKALVLKRKNGKVDPKDFLNAVAALEAIPPHLWAPEVIPIFEELRNEILSYLGTSHWNSVRSSVFISAAALDPEPNKTVARTHLAWKDPFNQQAYSCRPNLEPFWMTANKVREIAKLDPLDLEEVAKELAAFPIKKEERARRGEMLDSLLVIARANASLKTLHLLLDSLEASQKDDLKTGWEGECFRKSLALPPLTPEMQKQWLRIAQKLGGNLDSAYELQCAIELLKRNKIDLNNSEGQRFLSSFTDRFEELERSWVRGEHERSLLSLLRRLIDAKLANRLR